MQVVIPARDEADYVGSLLELLGQEPETRVTVIDGASSDATAAVATDAGARVIAEPRAGRALPPPRACSPAIRDGCSSAMRT